MALSFVSRSLALYARSPFTRSLSKRLFVSSSYPLIRRPSASSIARFAIPAADAARFTAVHCTVSQSGDSAYSPLKSGGGSWYSDRPPTKMPPLFPGCDYEHWLIVMDNPGGEGATKQQMIECYVKTLAQVVGSEEEAMKKMYNVSVKFDFGFGCEIDEETSNKLEGLPGVLYVLPDSYLDAKNKDYGPKLFVNGGDYSEISRETEG